MMIASPANAFMSGQRFAQESLEMRRENDLANLYKSQGAGIASGDPDALNALAQHDPFKARQMQMDNAANARQVETHEMKKESHGVGMQYDRVQLENARQAGKIAIEKHAASMSAEERKREAQEIDGMLSAASVAYKQGPEAYDAFVQTHATAIQEAGFDMSALGYDAFPQIAASLIGAKEGLSAGMGVMDDLHPAQDAPKVQKLTLDDGSEMAVQWNKQTGKWDPIDAPAGGGDITPKAKLTESQSKLTLFKSLQTETQPVLLDLEKQFNPANLPDAFANGVMGGNFVKTEQGQMYDAAATAWAEGALRIATGAAATPEEMERTKKAYFAQPGDTPKTIAFKAEMREMYDRSIQRALGNPSVEGSLPKPSEFAKRFNNDAPEVGKVVDGYRFKGGDPSDQNNWEKTE